MASDTEICNMALRHLGNGVVVANLTTEQTPEAKACRAFFDIVRDATLRDFNWPFATKFVDLGLVETDPTSEWTYAYRYPSDCINMRRIVSGIRNESATDRVVYKVGRDDSGKLIYTDQVNAQAEYTLKVTDPTEFTSDFVLAMSYHMAMILVPQIAKGDPFKLGEAAERRYMNFLSKAQAQAFNEEVPDALPEASYILARDSR